jgi:hypothetical protein
VTSERCVFSEAKATDEAVSSDSSAASAVAATWCVPDATIRSVCPSVSPTIQEAIDRAAPNDVIVVGPGNPAERITISKRVVIRGLPGHLITDVGLPPWGALVTITGPLERGPRFEFVFLDVVTSDIGVHIEPTVTFTEFRQAHVESARTPRPAIGIQASGTSRTWFIGTRKELDRSRVAGFQVGMELNDVDHVDVEYTTIEDNDVGIRLTRGGYQVFFNVFRNNGTALDVCGLAWCDINSNTFVENGLGVHWGLCHNPDTELAQQKMIEFNHNQFIANVENLLIEAAPGVWSPDFRHDPGCFVQWVNAVFDGVKQPSSKARNCLPL